MKNYKNMSIVKNTFESVGTGKFDLTIPAFNDAEHRICISYHITGSERQIDYAKSLISNCIIKTMESACARITSGLLSREAAMDALDAFLDEVLAHQDAAYWISRLGR